MSLSANSSFALAGRTPVEQEVTGETPDISEYLDFGFYGWVWYKHNAGVGDNSCGRWLDVSQRVGNLMSDWIFTFAGRDVFRTTMQRITNLEQGTSKVKERMKEYSERIKVLMKDKNHVIHGDGKRQLQDWDDYTDDHDEAFGDKYNNAISDKTIPDANEELTPDVFDNTFLNKEIAIARGAGDSEDVQYGRETKRLRDAEGQPIGTANDKPLLDTREFPVEVLDGHDESITTNLIAQHLYSQLDKEGKRHILLDNIVDHRKGMQAIDKEDAFVTMSNGVKRRSSRRKAGKCYASGETGARTGFR
jgi:hypothetical protein